jgi:hypothetical protein
VALLGKPGFMWCSVIILPHSLEDAALPLSIDLHHDFVVSNIRRGREILI